MKYYVCCILAIFVCTLFSCSKSDQLLNKIKSRFKDDKIEIDKSSDQRLLVVIYTRDVLGGDDLKKILDVSMDALPVKEEKGRFFHEIYYDRYEWETPKTKISLEVDQNTDEVISTDDDLQKGVYKLILVLENKEIY